MKHIKRFNESNIEKELSNIKEDIKGLTTYLSDEYQVRVITRSNNDKLSGIYVVVEKYEREREYNQLFQSDLEIKECFDTIIDYVNLKLENIRIGYYYSGQDSAYLSEDFHYDYFSGIELVIEDKENGPYFNHYFKL